jgi:hypothetical protein
MPAHDPQEHRHDASADALEQLASGQSPADSAGSPQRVDPVALDRPAEGGSSGQSPAPSPTQGDSTTTGSRGQRARSAHRRARQAYRLAFKKAMIPLLLVSGGLLLVLAGVALVMTSGQAGGESMGMFSVGTARTMIILAFPLAGVLLGGAWYFHRELANED